MYSPLLMKTFRETAKQIPKYPKNAQNMLNCQCSYVVILKEKNNPNTTSSDHVDWNRYSAETFPPPLEPSLFFWRVIWCVCDVLFDAHQMFIFPSPDGGTCLFLRELLGDRRGGGGLLFHNLKKILKLNCILHFSNTFLFSLKQKFQFRFE